MREVSQRGRRGGQGPGGSSPRQMGPGTSQPMCDPMHRGLPGREALCPEIFLGPH